MLANKQIIEILRAAVMTPASKGWGLPIIIEGEPGTGKTSQVVDCVASASGLASHVLIASLREPADFLGFPVVSEGTMSYAAPTWANDLVNADGGLVFLDELNTAPPAVQAALLRVTLDRVVGDVQLPGRTRFVAAQNATDDAAGGWDLAPPLANRFGHIKWDAPNVDDWTTWLLDDSRDLEPAVSVKELEAEITKQWPNMWSRARGLVTGFLRRRPEFLHKMPGAEDPQRSKAWPSPRSWENATRALASSYVHGLGDDATNIFFGAFVGDAVAYEFFNWLAECDLPDPVDVLEGRVEFKHDKFRLDRTAAVLNSCIGLVIPEDSENRNKRASTLWVLLADMVDDCADLVIVPAKALAKARLTKTAPARKALAKLQPILGLTAS